MRGSGTMDKYSKMSPCVLLVRCRIFLIDPNVRGSGTRRKIMKFSLFVLVVRSRNFSVPTVPGICTKAKIVKVLSVRGSGSKAKYFQSPHRGWNWH